jgi:hypothetical protein
MNLRVRRVTWESDILEVAIDLRALVDDSNGDAIAIASFALALRTGRARSCCCRFGCGVSWRQDVSSFKS